MDQDTSDRVMLARLRFAHMHQSITRALDDPEFARIMCDPELNKAPNLSDIAPTRTLH